MSLQDGCLEGRNCSPHRASGVYAGIDSAEAFAGGGGQAGLGDVGYSTCSLTECLLDLPKFFLSLVSLISLFKNVKLFH